MSALPHRHPKDDYPELPMGPGKAHSDPVFETVTGGAGGSSVAKAAISEDFGARLHEAQERLLELRQQQEVAERQRAELEDLRGKQDRFLRGRVDVVERLGKGLTRLDRETFQTRKRLEMLDHAKQNFGRHLDLIEAMKPEHWSRADLRNELVRAAAAVEDAEQDYAEAMARLGMTGPKADAATGSGPGADSPAAGWPNPKYWLLAGLAFTAPLMLLLVLAAILRPYLF